MDYSVMYDPNTGKAVVSMSQEEYERVVSGRKLTDILRDLLTSKRKPKK